MEISMWDLKDVKFIYKRSSLRSSGIHNTENILTALLTAHIYGVEQAITEDVLKTSRGSLTELSIYDHRWITFYNDSKATNVDAARRALESIDGNIVLIAGGKDKGGSYHAITDVADKIRALIVIGEAQEKIVHELGAT